MDLKTLATMSIRILAVILWIQSLSFLGQNIFASPGPIIVIFFVLVTFTAVILLATSKILGAVLAELTTFSTGQTGNGLAGLLPLAFSLIGMLLIITGVMKIPIILMMYDAEPISTQYLSPRQINSLLILNLAPVFKIIIGTFLIFRGKQLARYWFARSWPVQEEETAL
jgi:hypothetical protein